MGNCNCGKESFSIVEAVKSASAAVVSVVKPFVLKDYDPIAPEDVKKKRMSICLTCDYHHVLLKKDRCKICGCFLEAKTSLKEQSCPNPDGAKWQSVA